MKTRKNRRLAGMICGALCSMMLPSTMPLARAQATGSEHIVVTDPDAKMQASPTTNAHKMPPPGSDERADMMMQNARFMVDTLSEEKTEIAALKAQSAALRQMGGSRNVKIANLFDRMRREHEAAGPAMMKLTKSIGGDPNSAKIMKPPVLGSTAAMLHAAHTDHEKAVQMSQMRWKMANNPKVSAAMHKRANLARKHIRWMKPYHESMM
jgi:hypothetical protein